MSESKPNTDAKTNTDASIDSDVSQAGHEEKHSPLERTIAALDSTSEQVEALEWAENADRARVAQDPIKTRFLFYVICLAITSVVVWSAFAEIDQVTRGEGKVIPSQQVQVLQSLDGGVITEINVREGQVVEPGQLLIKLDATRFFSTLQESRAELLALQAKAIRLQALASGRDFVPPESLIEEAPDLVEQERILYLSSQEELAVLKEIALQQIEQREQELVEATAHRDQAEKSLRLSSKELAVTEPLVDSGAVSEVEILRLQRDVANMTGERDQAQAQISRLRSAIREAKQKIREVELNYKNDIREDLSITMARLNVLEESSLGLSDRVKQTAIRSPVRGTVKRLFYNTIGGVVLSGKEVVEIIPLDDTLLLEARIKPQDIAFLRPKQKAHVKFTAYDFVVYGGLDAHIEHIGADTVMDEDGNPYYVVRVRTAESSLGEGRPIIPGMVASVDILSGKKTILNYMLKPLLRAKQYALTER